MTHRAASYDARIRRPTIILALLGAVALAACGSQRSTLPPAPSASGLIALRELAHHPEVYANASVVTDGTVARSGAGAKRPFVLVGGHGARIALEPASRAAGELGRSVRVAGIFSVSFQLGYEILISRITPVARL